MANIKSAKKRVITSAKRNLHNRMIMSDVKTATKKFEEAVAAGDKAAAQELYPLAVKKWDMAAGKKVVHKNAANRRKASFYAKLNAMA
ncbi:MAG: 30S ribosomal protein S20 [Clostridia bacterium]|nr:30S ribosomal protein S20 [Clostridia bacterium]